jgi:membrane fusion protein (multidrug efflux system)
VVAETADRVSVIRFEEGGRVAGGDVLVELDGTREQAELLEALAQRSDVRRQLERARQLLARQHVPPAQVDELEAALAAADARVAVMQSRLAERQIRAPFDGIVGLRDVSLGAYVTPGQRLTTLDDLTVIRLEFAVPERFLGQLRPDLRVIARSPAFGLTEFTGTLSRIDTRVDPATRTVRVQAEFPNPDGRLRAGMFLGVELIFRRWEGVMVAEQAVISEGNRHVLFVVDGDHQTAHRREVTLGQRREGEVEIRAGLEAGEHVVVEGIQRVVDNAPVRVLHTDTPGDGSSPSAASPREVSQEVTN